MSSKLNILHLVISLETGGLERFVLDLIETNVPYCNQLVICLEGLGPLAKNCSTDIVALNMPAGLHLSFARTISKIARERNIDLIHTHNEKAQFYGGLAGLLAGVPVLHTKHGRNELDWRTRLRNSFSAILCNKIVAVSHDAARECVDEEKIPATKVLTILNGINTCRFSADNNPATEKNRLGIVDDTLVIGVVARLAPVKDHATLLNTCKILKESETKFKLLIVGDGSLRQQLVDLASTLGVEKQVMFVGMREDIPELMQAMDVFVLSSLSEGLSLTLLEAMASGLPVVATNVGGNSEVIIDGVTGYLVPPQNPHRISGALLALMQNSVLRLQMGAAGRQRVLQHFSITETSRQYKALYQEVLGVM